MMASRSTVRMPVAVACAAARLASGDSSDFGSEAMFMAPFWRRHASIQPRALRLMAVIRQLAAMGEVAESRDGGVEVQFDRARRAVALLADNHFSPAERPLHVLHPLRVLLGAGPRLLHGEV